MPNQSTRARVRKYVIDLRGRESRIDRNDDDTQPTARIYKLDILGAIGKKECQPIARPEADAGESGSQALHAVVKLTKTQPATLRAESAGRSA